MNTDSIIRTHLDQKLLYRFLSLAKCPKEYCGGSLKLANDDLVCSIDRQHKYQKSFSGDYYILAPPEDDPITAWSLQTIYATEKIARHYTGLWAFGQHLLYDPDFLQKGWLVGRGETDIFYRLITQLALEKFEKDQQYDICDIGCGVGRCVYDLASLFSNSYVFGFDISDNMLNMANRMLFHEGDFEIDLSDAGFGKRIVYRKYLPVLPNAFIFQANAESIPLKENSTDSGFDLVLNINVLDRTLHPEAVLKSSMEIIKPGGGLIIAVSGSWQEDKHWTTYGPVLEWCLSNLQQRGFIPEYISDQVTFREIINSRGASEEYPMFVIFARA